MLATRIILKRNFDRTDAEEQQTLGWNFSALLLLLLPIQIKTPSEVFDAQLNHFYRQENEDSDSCNEKNGFSLC